MIKISIRFPLKAQNAFKNSKVFDKIKKLANALTNVKSDVIMTSFINL